MKVVCDGCRAKYQIPDDRVVGKKLKIRCRRCAGMIILRGDLMEPEAQGGQIVAAPTMSLVPPAAVMPDQAPPQQAPEVEWHAISGGNQIGPFSTDELAELLSAGQLAWDDYVWCEGLEDWTGAAQVDALIQAVEAVQQDQADDAPTRMFSSGTTGQVQPVQAQSYPPQAAQQSQPPAAYTDYGQSPTAYSSYSQPPTAYSSGDGGLNFGGAPDPVSSPVVSHDMAMTGGRHEDSVLFSAQNLATYSEPTPDTGGNGYASGDGSGLIDIRALASIAAQSSAPPAHATAPLQPAGDDLMRLAHQTGAFSNLDSLAPVSDTSRKASNALPLAILAGSGIVAAAAFAAVYITRVPAEPASGTVAVAAAAAPTAAQTEAPAAPESELEASAVAPAAESAAEPAATEEDAEQTSADEPVPESEAAPPSRTSARAKKGRRAAAKPARAAAAPTKSRSKAAAKAEPEEATKTEGPSIDDLLLGESKKPAPEPEAVAATEEPKAKEPPKDRSIDDLLSTAVDDAKRNDAKKRRGKDAALPESPDRSQVLSAMRGVQGAVKACAAGAAEGGTAKVALTVAGSSGKVTNVRVSGVEGPVGSCIAKAVREAKFPKFSKPDFSINYPFRL